VSARPAGGVAAAGEAAAGKAGEAAAAAGVAGLVIEVHVGERPEDASELVAPVLSELEARGYAAGPAQAAALIEARASRRGLAGEVSADTLRAEVNAGYQKFLAGSFQEARAALSAALEVLHANPALIASDQTMQPVQRRALVGLALAHRRLGEDAAAAEAMAELLRTSPGVEISVREYGPEPVELFRAVAAEMARQGHGKLVVETKDPTALVFINESFRGVGEVEAELPVGPYRVYVQRGKEIGRVYDVTIARDRESRLLVDPAFDATIRSTAKWTGLLLPESGEVQEQAIAYAARLGRAVGVEQVVLVGPRPGEGGALELVGTVVGMKGRRVVRQASISLGKDTSPAARAALGRFLAGEDPSADLEVVVQDGRPFEVAAAAPDRSSSPWNWVATTGAAAALGTGIALVALDGTCRGEEPAGAAACRDLWATAPAGWVSIGVGGALAITAGYLFWRDAQRAQQSDVQVAVVPSAGGVRVWAGFEF